MQGLLCHMRLDGLQLHVGNLLFNSRRPGVPLCRIRLSRLDWKGLCKMYLVCLHLFWLPAWPCWGFCCHRRNHLLHAAPRRCQRCPCRCISGTALCSCGSHRLLLQAPAAGILGGPGDAPPPTATRPAWPSIPSCAWHSKSSAPLGSPYFTTAMVVREPMNDTERASDLKLQEVAQGLKQPTRHGFVRGQGQHMA